MDQNDTRPASGTAEKVQALRKHIQQLPPEAREQLRQLLRPLKPTKPSADDPEMARLK